MKLLRLMLITLATAGLAACGKKQAPETKTPAVTDSARKEATLHVSEAQFALSVRQWDRAEPLLAKAAALTPDVPAVWLELGKTRMRLKQRGPAKTAYERALAGFAKSAKNQPKDPQWVVEQAVVLVFLGRADEARAMVEKMPAQFPDNPQVKAYAARKPIDAVLADPVLKEFAL